MQAPDGVVTFLFTDIEGSTQRVHALGQATWLRVLEDHNAIVRAALAAHDGYEVKTEGDAFFATFADAAAAVGACRQAQRDLAEHRWPPGAPIKVRMGLHTGEAHVVDGDYVGLAVHEAARIAATGHGGQTVLSEATRQAAGLEPPLVRSLGQHALKDFPEPQELHQLVDPARPESFPALRTQTAAEHNLPVAPTALLGRAAEVAQCVDLLLDGARLVTLTGPGGIGKTRLALAVGERLLAYYRMGVWLVGLASVDSVDRIVPAINDALGVMETAGDTPFTALTRRLSGNGSALLLLDNYEHLADGALVVSDLLAACGNVSVLVTSRSRLRLRGEHDVAVEPLAPAASGELFVARATETQARFEPSPVVEEICTFLEGMPLALELAAARVGDLGLQGIRDGLQRSLDLLDEGAVDLPPRQQALRSTIAWSVDLLPPAARRVFAQLGVFAGGADQRAVEAVVGDTAQLRNLTDASLIRRDRDRFTMLQTIRQYAWEQLPAEQAEPTRDAHGGWFHSFALEAGRELTGPDQVEWLDRLGTDHDNLRAALDHLLGSEPSSAATMTAALGRFWEVRGFWAEARQRTQAALDAVPGQDPARADLLHWSGRQQMNAGDLAAAAESHREALNHRLRAGDLAGAGRSADQLGEVCRLSGDLDGATSYYESALGHFRTVGDRHGLATTLQNLAAVRLMKLDHAGAAELLQQAFDVLEELRDLRGAARVMLNLGYTRLQLGQTEQALSLLAQSAERFERIGDREGTAAALSNLGLAAREADDYDSAVEHWLAALAIERELGNQSTTAVLLYNLYETENARDAPAEVALAYAREALELFRPLGNDHVVGTLLYVVGRNAWADGDPAHALTLLQEAAALRRARGELVEESIYRVVAAAIAGEQGDAALVRELRMRVLACLEGFGSVREHLRTISPHLLPWPSERDWLVAAAADLGEGS